MPRIQDYTLEEPEEEKSQVDQIIELYFGAAAEFKTTKERDYWQGRKDGLRAALAILEPGKDGREWDELNKSSHGFRVTEKEGLLKMLEDARYNIGAALYDYSDNKNRKIHIQTVVNLLQWLDLYDRKAGEGELTPTPDAITPEWKKLAGR